MQTLITLLYIVGGLLAIGLISGVIYADEVMKRNERLHARVLERNPERKHLTSAR